ncbi:uncharacterized protein LOC143024416 [Oratosquilla oratoria]|uniref:uncharacterized protein LOC143024416 n=1 Tax=Oratosquilla oratoria TaxID=337810 RepID=UPI003F76A7D6
MQQREKEQEGCALLDLYKLRATRWQARREMEEAESKMAVVQAVTSSTHAHLTRLRLALSNLYSVARTYQRSLPPLGLDPNPSLVLSRLYNFLQDAITVTQCAAQVTSPASSRPTHGSTLSPIHDIQSFSKPQRASPPSPSVSVPNTTQSRPSSSSGRSSGRSRRRRSATQVKSPRGNGDTDKKDVRQGSAQAGGHHAATPTSSATNATS